MAHLTEQDIFFYSHELWPQEKILAADKHMRHCPKCQAAFLDLLEAEGSEQQAILPPDFNAQVMQRLEQSKQSNQRGKKRFDRPLWQVLTYYAAAAAVALALMGGALFGLVNEGTGHKVARQESALKGWVESFGNQTSNFLDNIEGEADPIKVDELEPIPESITPPEDNKPDSFKQSGERRDYFA